MRFAGSNARSVRNLVAAVRTPARRRARRRRSRGSTFQRPRSGRGRATRAPARARWPSRRGKTPRNSMPPRDASCPALQLPPFVFEPELRAQQAARIVRHATQPRFVGETALALRRRFRGRRRLARLARLVAGLRRTLLRERALHAFAL